MRALYIYVPYIYIYVPYVYTCPVRTLHAVQVKYVDVNAGSEQARVAGSGADSPGYTSVQQCCDKPPAHTRSSLEEFPCVLHLKRFDLEEVPLPLLSTLGDRFN